MIKKYSHLLPIVLCLLSLVISGCDNKNQTSSTLSISIINNNLFHTEPELLPHSKLIKQQRIEGDSNKTINYNDQGYITRYALEGLNAEINYDTAKYSYGFGATKNNYDITFDDSKTILDMKNSNGDSVANSEFDEQGHLVGITLSRFADNNIIFHSKIIYTHGSDSVEQILYDAYVPVDDKTQFPVFSQQKDITYNVNHELDKIVTQTFKLSSDGDILIDDKNQKEVESIETCTYSDYNENGDWTKAICVTTGNEPKTANLTRTIEY